ncbi:MAG: S-adenosylmethionine:tRNA ribosyltransferase-isomerase [Bacteroidales bacterium]|nr:S-adenosylmethionine:tRNA ribosyltransferase-isomerase [Bacteroidales bacterium]
MQSPKNISIEEYNYPLPDNRIARYPLQQRDQSKLLVWNKGKLSESQFFHLPQFLPTDSLLVFNNTKVIHARLLFQKTTGSTIEIFCLEPTTLSIIDAFAQTERCEWMCFIGNNKKWKEGALHRTITIEGREIVLSAERGEAVGNAWMVTFSWNGGCSLSEIIDQAGVIPLPPYLHRDAEQSDNERYQTVYAEHQGSVAAPTAGLHFTDRVFADLEKQGIETEFITLHVGAGTFKPVTTATIGEHEMHVEKVQITRDNLLHILHHSGNLIAVGTTTVRTLESLYWFGVKLSQNSSLDAMHVLQWDPYQLEELHIDSKEALHNVLEWMEQHDTDHLDGDTQLMIAPSYRYHIINGIVTNFHQPKSTLLLLVSALIGDAWKECYHYALDHEFRFLSYGDSCLFIPLR